MNLISSVQQQHTKLALTSISDFIHSSGVVIMWQTDGTAHKLKLRSFYKFMSLSIEFTYSMLWNTLDTNIFLFLLSIFLDFIFLFFWISFSFIDDEEAHDIAVTWLVTWCDIIGLEHGRRIWKMTLGHMVYIW